MKKFTTKLSIVLCVLFLGMSITLPVSGQTNETVTTIKKGIFEKIHQKNKPEYPNLKSGDLPELYKSTNGTYPQEIHHYYWDVTTIWMADFDFFTTYDSQANILTQIMIMANTNDTSGRITNTYDSEGNLTESLVQSYYNGSWENSYRNVNTYDNQGNRLVYLSQTWQYPNWVTNYGSKHIYTYDANYNITEEISQNWNTNSIAWENNYKDIYSYDANGYLIEYISQFWDSYTSLWISSEKEIYTNSAVGTIIEALLQEWDEYSSMWVNYEKIIDIVWYNWTGDLYESDLESFTSLEWASGIWENSYRVNITYDAYGSSIEIEEVYLNGNWENSYKYSDMYDQHGNELGYSDEYWDNGVWIMSYGDKYLLTYSGMDLVERIYQFWDYEMESYENSWKEEYSDFITIQAVEKNILSSASIKLYPNPVNEILKLELKNLDIENFSIEIINVDGQVIYYQHFTDESQLNNGINISEYSKGIYFVKVQNEKEIKVGKVLIQ